MMDRWIPYLFQNNITCLDVPDQIKCVTGLVGADVDKAITNVLNKTVAGGWGPNAIFRFPRRREVGVALTRRYLDSNNNSKNIFALRSITMPLSRFVFFAGRHRSLLEDRQQELRPPGQAAVQLEGRQNQRGREESHLREKRRYYVV